MSPATFTCSRDLPGDSRPPEFAYFMSSGTLLMMRRLTRDLKTDYSRSHCPPRPCDLRFMETPSTASEGELATRAISRMLGGDAPGDVQILPGIESRGRNNPPMKNRACLSWDRPAGVLTIFLALVVAGCGGGTSPSPANTHVTPVKASESSAAVTKKGTRTDRGQALAPGDDRGHVAGYGEATKLGPAYSTWAHACSKML